MSEAKAPREGRKDMLGRRFGRYSLVQHLATGGMAEIFLARHEGPSEFPGFVKDLVLKTLQGRYADDPQVMKMFVEEARLAAMLNHPSIVDVYDVGTEEGVHYIAMEYIAGKTLADLVRRGIEVSRPLPVAHTVFIVAQVAEGLAFMQAGTDSSGKPFEVVHRDISPPNLIVDFTGQTKIIDFGIARQGSAVNEESGARPGKMSYMSPEQVKGYALDGRSDIFSLGTILYEMTLQKRLWRGPAEVVMGRIVDQNPPPPTYIDRDYPRALELIVMKALEKRPEDRYQTAAHMFRDLIAFAETQGLRVATPQVAEYMDELFAPEVQPSPTGERRARAFAIDDEFPDDDFEDLDFDRVPSGAAGAALAEALRANGPLMSPLVPRLAPSADMPPAPTSDPGPPVPAVDVKSSRRSWRWGVLVAIGAVASLIWVLVRS